MAGVTALSGNAIAAQDRIEHAVFTSLRSYVARGYRLVAASRGLSEDEQREIVQRAPSHGNLDDSSESASAGAVFTLRSGRVAVLLSRHAGPEGSGRGGLRVHTDALVLTTALYAAQGALPGRIARLAADALQASLRGTPTPVLPAIVPGNGVTSCTCGGVAVPVEHSAALTVLAAALSGRKLLVCGLAASGALAESALAVVPRALRSGVSIAWGMKLAVQRVFPLLLVRQADADCAAFAAEHGYTILHWPTPARSEDRSAWLDYVAECWQRGRGDAVAQLADELATDSASETLEQSIEIARSMDELATADATTVESIARRADRFANRIPVALRERLCRRIAARQQELAAAEAAQLAPPQT